MTKKSWMVLTAMIFMVAICIIAADTSNVNAGEKILVAQNKGGSSGSDLIYAADVISMKGKGFKVKRVNTSDWMRGHVNMPNYIKDVLETDGDTLACLEFMNGSQLGINKNTTVEIISKTAATDITQRGVVEKVVLKSGTIWAKVTGQKQKEFQVETGKGVLGVKGTEFVVETDIEKDTEKITVLDGEVEFKKEDGEAESLTPGESLLFVESEAPTRKKEDIKKLRDALNFNFPGLNPAEQAIISIFVNRAIGNIPEVGNALSVARQTVNIIEDPEKYVKDRAISEIGNRTGVTVPGGLFGGGGKKESKKVEIANLKPDGATIDTYYPELSWDKVEGAQSYRVMVTRNPIEKDEKDPGYYAYANIPENKFKYPATARALKPGDTYYWTVVPLDKEDKALAVPKKAATFTMADYTKLGIRGLFPSGDTEQVEGDMVFDWTPVRGVKKYKMEVSNKENMENPLLTKEVDINYVSIENASNYFFKDKEYFWKVTPMEKEAGTPEISGAVNTFKITGEKKNQ